MPLIENNTVIKTDFARITDALGRLSPYHTGLFEYPIVRSDTVEILEFTAFYKQLNHKLHQSALRLKELRINSSIIQTLQALQAYLETDGSVFYVDTLTLSLHDVLEANAIITLLIPLFPILQHSGITELQLTDANNNFKRECWDQLHEALTQHPIPISVTLPTHLQEQVLPRTYQRDINDASAKIKRDVRSTHLTVSKPDLRQTDTRNTLRTRSRKQGNVSRIEIDIQQEMERETEAVSQHSRHSIALIGGNHRPDDYHVRAIILENFKEYIRRAQTTGIQNYPERYDSRYLLQCWAQWTGQPLVQKDNDSSGYIDLTAIPYTEIPDDIDNPWEMTDSATTSFTLSAAEMMLKHVEQFQYGIDIYHLPAGFIVTKQLGYNTPLVHYDEREKLTAEPDPLSPCLPEPTTLPIVETDIIEDIFASANQTPALSILIQIWRAVRNNDEYDPQIEFIFKRHFPELLYLESQMLFSLELDNEETPSNRINQLIECTQNSLSRVSLLQVQNNDNAPTSFMINTLIKSAKLISGLEYFTLTYQPDGLVDRALLRTLSAVGESGLHMILESWRSYNVADFDVVFEVYLSKMNTYDTCCDHEKLDQTMRLIADFSPDEKHWWTTLIQQHAHAGAYVDIHHLSAAFDYFRNVIRTLGLQFYSPVHFKGIKNMSVALSRMLWIIQRSSPEDIQPQWQGITQLALSTYETMNALTTKQPFAEECLNFVIPEMNISVLSIEDHINQFGYSTKLNWKAVPSQANDSQLKQHYLRYVAGQKHRMPIAFYLNMFALINARTLSNCEVYSLKSKVYHFLVGTTVGEEAVHMINQDKAYALDCITEVLDTIEKLDFISKLSTAKRVLVNALLLTKNKDEIKSKIIDSLLSIKNLPLTIAGRIKEAIIDILKEDLGTAEQKLNQLEFFINPLIEWMGSSYYMSFSFYTAEQYDEYSRYAICINQAILSIALSRQYKLYHEKRRQDEPSLRQNAYSNIGVKVIIALMSTFNLLGTNENIRLNEIPLNVEDSLFQDIGDDYMDLIMALSELDMYCNFHSKLAIHRGLSAMQYMRTRGDYPLLSRADLIQLLISFRMAYEANTQNLNDRLVFHIIQERFQIYFEPNYFAKFNVEAIPPEVELCITKNILKPRDRECLIQILMHFDPDTLPERRIECAKLLVSLCQSVPAETQTELLRLIHDHLQSGGLFAPDRQDKGVDPITLFIDMLHSIMERGRVDDCIFWIAQEERHRQRNESPHVQYHFIKKTAYYLRTGLELVDELLNAHPNLSRDDILIPMITLILNENSEHLHAKKIDLNLPEQRLFTMMTDEIQRLSVRDKNEETVVCFANHLSEFLQNPNIQTLSTPMMHTLLEHCGQYIQACKTEKIRQTINSELDAIQALIRNNQIHIETIKIYEIKTADALKKLKPNKKNTQQLSDLSNQLSTYSNQKLSLNQELSRLNEQLRECRSRLANLPISTDASHGPIEINQNLLSESLAECQHVSTVFESPKWTITQIFNEFATAHKNHPSTKQPLLHLLTRFLISPEKHSHHSQIRDSYFNVHFMNCYLHSFSESNTFLGLCKYATSGTHIISPESLFMTFSRVSRKELNFEKVQFILTGVVNHINDHRFCQIEDIDALTSLLHNSDTGDALFNLIKPYYISAPYPTFHELIEVYHRIGNHDPEELSHQLNQFMSDYDMNPSPREPDSQFNPEYAKSQANLMLGFNKYRQTSFDTIPTIIFEIQKYRTADLINRVKNLRQCSLSGEVTHHDTIELIASLAEILHRTKGKSLLDTNGNLHRGDSFEINTTQFLAIHSALSKGGHVTSNIDTSEGKTRIMMLLIACQYALGKTPDYITSNMQLAEEHLLEYCSFFEAIGAKTHIIYSNSMIEDYDLNGIHFSDTANISLFRNRARSEGMKDRVLHRNSNQRALFLDEGDSTFNKLFDRRFNYTDASDESLKDMEWVYPIIMDFFAQENLSLRTDVKNLYYDDIESCNELFLSFARVRCNHQQNARLKMVSQSQIEQWHDAAMNAKRLRYLIDYIIEPNVAISTPNGPKISSIAVLIAENRADPRSRFSLCVHQCLHAELMRLKNIAHAEHMNEHSHSPLSSQLLKCTQPFHIEEDKQIIYSSNSHRFLLDYTQGELYAATGSAGPLQERLEAARYYGKNNDLMSFIDMPRHRHRKRSDGTLLLLANHNHYVNAIVHEIRQALSKQQPILLFCNTDQDCFDLAMDLATHFPSQEFADQIHLIHAGTSPKDEAEHIRHRAGKPQVITISTKKLARGTDIKLHHAAKQYGLHTIVSFMPTDASDVIQMLGRSARAGDNGSTRIITTIEQLEHGFNNAIRLNDLLRFTDGYIHQQQVISERIKQIDRIIKYTVSEFRDALADQFYEIFFLMLNSQERRQARRYYQQFFSETDKRWSTFWAGLSESIDRIEPDMTNIQHSLNGFQQDIVAIWDAMKRALIANGNIAASVVDRYLSIPEKYQFSLPIKPNIVSLINSFEIPDMTAHPLKVYHYYDPALAGRTRVLAPGYDTSTQPWFASWKAWRRNEGILFANLRFKWKQYQFGRISLFNLFFSRMVTIARILDQYHRTSSVANHSAMIEYSRQNDNDKAYANTEEVLFSSNVPRAEREDHTHAADTPDTTNTTNTTDTTDLKDSSDLTNAVDPVDLSITSLSEQFSQQLSYHEDDDGRGVFGSPIGMNRRRAQEQGIPLNDTPPKIIMGVGNKF